MRAFTISLICAVWAVSASANPNVDRLMEAMQVPAFMEILSDEGREQGRMMNEGLLGGSGGAYFAAQVADLYDPEQMTAQMAETVGLHMTEAQLEQAAIFFESDLGQTIVSLENSARRAMGEDTIEDMARSTYQTVDTDSAFYQLVDEYIRVNDLIDQNVRGTISADFSFYRGLSSGPGVPADDEAILSELLSNQDNTEEETTEWMYAFLLLAYQPLNEGQLRENIAFSRTDTGQALNHALFEGFDSLINDISYQLGAAVAQAMRASDL